MSIKQLPERCGFFFGVSGISSGGTWFVKLMAFTATCLVRLVQLTTTATSASTTATLPPIIKATAATTSNLDDASPASDFGSKPLPR